MQRISPLITPEDDLDETRRRLAAAPALRAYIAGLSRPGRSKLRTRLTAHGYSQAQIGALLPMLKGGRPSKPPAGTFEGLSMPARGAIADALGAEDFPTDLADWDEASATLAATAITDHYTNPTSAAVALFYLRVGLKALGAPQAAVAATHRPAITEAHNARAEVRRAERAAAGLNIPAPFQRIADLRSRVDGYIAAGPAWVPDGQAAADLLVTLSARPGEAETLDLGERGGVTGMLKKRGSSDAYNLISALGRPRAEALLAAWKRADATARRVAMRDLGRLVHSWDIDRRDLRAIGAYLATRAAVLAGEAKNAVEVRDVTVGALRHEPGQRRAAVDYYQRVNDPVGLLAAQLGELSVGDLDKVRGLVGLLTSK